MEENSDKTKNIEDNFKYIVTSVLIFVLILTLFNTWQVIGLLNGIKTGTITGAATSVSAGIDVIPKGIPEIYGKELSISYDDVSASNQKKADETIRKLAMYDINIKLSGDLLKRYINIAGNISCEYCCGASAIIFTKDVSKYKAGDAACGCAHSAAMRGLAKYLLQNHADEYTDEQILEELGKWKTLFFPDIMAQKAKVLKDNGIELNYINLASNKYRGIEYKTLSSSSGNGMIGGC